MKKFTLIFALLLLVASTALAQKNPVEIQWVTEDSTDLVLWNIGVGTDSDTSNAFVITHLPEAGLGFHIYWNATDADTGSIVLILQQTILNNDYSTFASFDDSAYAITGIATWAYADSFNFGGIGTANNTATATGRGSIVWNPTLTGPATRARIVAIRRSGTTARTIAIAAIKEY